MPPPTAQTNGTANAPTGTPAPTWIDCGRYGYLVDEFNPPHWLTLPAPETPILAPAHTGPAAAPKAAAVLQECSLKQLRSLLQQELNDPITARSSARLTDRISSGTSTRFTTVDDTAATPPVWPVVTIHAPDDFQYLLEIHDAAWTGFEHSGAGLVLHIDPPAHTADIFSWLPVVDRFFDRHATLPVLLDAMGPTDVKGWDQLVRLGSDAQVYGLARGIPGLPADRRGLPLEQLTPLELRRADAILHFYVGEAGAERILFGSGRGRLCPLDEAPIDLEAQWFAKERPWLDRASAAFILTANATRLAQRPR